MSGGWEIVSLLSGIGIVFLYGWNKFPEDSLGLKDGFKNRIISQVFLRDLTLKAYFARALVLYMIILEAFYLTIVAVGRELGIKGTENMTSSAWPLFCALIVTGLLPNIPYASTLEPWLRRLMHSRARITSAVEDVRQKLERRWLGWDGLRPAAHNEVFSTPDIEAAFTGGSESSDVNRWLRASLLIERILQSTADDVDVKRYSSAYLDRYRPIWTSIVDDYRYLREAMGLSTSTTLTQLETACAKFRKTIDKLYDDTFSFVSCVVVGRPDHVDEEDILKVLSFSTEASDDERRARSRRLRAEADTLVDAFLQGAWVTLLVVFVVSLLNHPTMLAVQAIERGGWLSAEQLSFFQVSLPNLSGLRANVWAYFFEFLTLALTMAAVFFARSRLIAGGYWFRNEAEPWVQPGARKYFPLVLVALFVAAIILFLLDSLTTLNVSQICASGWNDPLCRREVLAKVEIFADRMWVKVLYVAGAAICWILYVEYFRYARRRGEIVWKAVLFSLLLTVLNSLVLSNLEAVRIRSSTSVSFDFVYVAIGATSAAAFWVAFFRKFLRTNAKWRLG